MIGTRLGKLVPIAAICALSLVVTSQASASNVTVSSSTTAMTTSAVYFKIAALSPVTIACSSANESGTAAGGTGVTLPFAISTDAAFAFSGCTAFGVPVRLDCVSAGKATISVTFQTVSGITPLVVTRISCRVTNSGCATDPVMTGSVAARFTNGPGARFTIIGIAAAQNLRMVTSSGCFTGNVTMSSSSTAAADIAYAVIPSTMTVTAS